LSRAWGTTLALGLSVIATACGATGASATTVAKKANFHNRVLTIGSEVFPVTLDPTANASAAIDEVVDYNVLQHLVQLAPNGQLVPVLASSWTTTQQNKVYTFTIRQGVHFSNGDLLTASDVVYSLKRVFAPGSTYPYAKIFDVASVVATSPTTVQVTLTTPSWDWLFDLAAYSNGVIIDPKTVSTLGTDPIGTGPYEVTNEVNNYSITLARNPHYFGTPARVSGVTFRYFASPSAEDAALRSGAINVIDNLGDPSALQSFKGKAGFRIISGLTNGKVQVTLNNAYGPLKNVLVRRAIAYGTDKKALIKVAEGGYGIPLGSDSVPADPYYLNLANTYPYNPTKALQLLRQAGYPHGFSLQLTLPPYPYAQLAGPLFASEMAKINIHVTIQNVPFPLWLSRVFEGGDFQATIIDHAEARDIGNYGTAGYYWHYAGTSQVATMLAQGAAAPTKAQWISTYQRVLKKITGDAVNDWLYVLPQLTVAQRDVTGLPKSAYTESFDLSHVGFGGSLASSTTKLGYLS
jgi:peptide/nickel transport system substrate-binding protein